MGEDLDLTLELGVGADLAMRVAVATYLGEPPAHLLLHRDDADCHVRPRGLKPPLEPPARRQVAFPLGEMVCSKNQRWYFDGAF